MSIDMTNTSWEMTKIMYNGMTPKQILIADTTKLMSSIRYRWQREIWLPVATASISAD